MNNILKAAKPKEIRKRMLIASYDLTKNTSICPAQEFKNIINNRTLFGEVEVPTYELSDSDSIKYLKRCCSIDKSKAIVKLVNITVDNKLVNTETLEEIKTDYVYNENHFIRLNIYADVEIINEELAIEANITLDNIVLATRCLIKKMKSGANILTHVLAYDIVKELDEKTRYLVTDIDSTAICEEYEMYKSDNM